MQIEVKAKYKGFSYLVVAHEMGHRCGYVRILKGSRWYGKDYDSIPFSVHGGLTFADKFSHKELPKGWWIGFDCAHFIVTGKQIGRAHV